ncbi:Dimethylaniline monooxygenase [Elsinoe australis]|uniref:Dimethylaniline monooxygenase n=1 Tax=Elsinoe australis TaxID=40998 RepID=A0A2P7ZQE3_9PEZI|nr:Dimethylaniline monooxygenase [Elsinoe australis]
MACSIPPEKLKRPSKRTTFADRMRYYEEHPDEWDAEQKKIEDILEESEGFLEREYPTLVRDDRNTIKPRTPYWIWEHQHVKIIADGWCATLLDHPELNPTPEEMAEWENVPHERSLLDTANVHTQVFADPVIPGLYWGGKTFLLCKWGRDVVRGGDEEPFEGWLVDVVAALPRNIVRRGDDAEPLPASYMDKLGALPRDICRRGDGPDPFPAVTQDRLDIERRKENVREGEGSDGMPFVRHFERMERGKKVGVTEVHMAEFI